MNKPSEWVTLGRFGRPQGLQGWVRVISFTQPDTAILDYLPWCAQKKEQWQPIEVINAQVQNQKILVKIEGYTEREEVAEFTNCEIGVLASQLPQLSDDEYYWHELTHMQVVNKNGVSLGNVTQMIPTGANEVLVVQGKKRYLIPYILDVYIVSIDRSKRQIVVDWDETF